MNKEVKTNSLELLKSIANRKTDSEAAKRDFTLFVGYFESKITKYAVIHANYLGFPEQAAYNAVECTFAKVWDYAKSFKREKSHCKNNENAIMVWMKSIVTSQLYEYQNKKVCYQQKDEEDLSVVEDTVTFVDYRYSHLSAEEKMDIVVALNKKMSKLDEKHRIVCLTYLAYEGRGKYLPSRLVEKLRNRLGLAKATLRVYKGHAYKTIGLKI